MKKTPPGTRALIREYLRLTKEEEFWGTLSFEEEISKRVGPGNAVVLDGKVISAHKGELQQGKTSHWISVENRITLDDQDDMIPVVKSPLDNLEDEHTEQEEETFIPKKKK